MEKTDTTKPDSEDFFGEKKRVRNPLVPVGALMTAGVLTAGLISFRQGNSQLGQVLMRARVVAQGATVALMAKDPLFGETLAAVRAAKLAQDQNWTHVKLETDSQQLRNGLIQSDQATCWKIEALILP